MSLIVQCPHCQLYIIIEQLNCGIFRHCAICCCGIPSQISPHASKSLCEDWLSHPSAIGCGKPFRVTMINGTYQAVVCDYI